MADDSRVPIGEEIAYLLDTEASKMYAIGREDLTPGFTAAANFVRWYAGLAVAAPAAPAPANACSTRVLPGGYLWCDPHNQWADQCLLGAAPGRAPAPEPTKVWERSGGSWTSYLTEIGRKEMGEGRVMRAEWFTGAPTHDPETTQILSGAARPAEPPPADTALLDWLDSLPSGIVINGDAAFQQSMGMTPKEPGFSHTRDLICRAMKARGFELRAAPPPAKTGLPITAGLTELLAFVQDHAITDFMRALGVYVAVVRERAAEFRSCPKCHAEYDTSETHQCCR